jgi:hypothetical protein
MDQEEFDWEIGQVENAGGEETCSDSPPPTVRRGRRSRYVVGLDKQLTDLLPGKCSNVYGVLYDRTLGAREPLEEIQTPKSEIGKWAGVTNRATLIKHLRHLETLGLLTRTLSLGDTGGALYRVHRLEDVGVSQEAAERFYLKRRQGKGKRVF